MEPLTTRFTNEVFTPYLGLLKSNYRFHRAFGHARESWEEKLTERELVHGPFLEKSQTYAPGEPIEELALHANTVETINADLGGRGLYEHQTIAIRLALSGENAIVATGTSSGKTLCYQVPILDDLVRNSSQGLRAIIIYPLNALVNDQLSKWEQILRNHSDITFARFTGQTPDSQKRYEELLRIQVEQELIEREPQLSEAQRQRKVERELAARLAAAPKNRLNHRDAIRARPPHILITNFSMLEYLLERPVDASIFENTRLQFLVLDEIHAYRGVQSTEIGFLIRRLKDRLRTERVTCIGTSATLGKDEEESRAKVRQFATDIFGAPFSEPNPIRGTTADPEIRTPSHRPTSAQYQEAATALRQNEPMQSVLKRLGVRVEANDLADALAYDENLHRLRTEILTKPILLTDAAEKLFPNTPKSSEALQALLELIAASGQEGQLEEFLPTRLHYFVRAQAGLHACLRNDCPGREKADPAFFVSRQNDMTSRGERVPDCPDGCCPDCHAVGRRSLLVETVSCRKCGYLYGALQDLGPRRAQNPDKQPGQPEAAFDSFSTELGWAADSFWSYFSAETDLPFPKNVGAEDDDPDTENLLEVPKELNWCVACGKKRFQGAGDNCVCSTPYLRKIQVFHRQCDHLKTENLYAQTKKALPCCPNCGARNASGIEPVQRFQESEDETGMAMAIPLAHFQVSPPLLDQKPPRKLLCFADHRQRAAAFPSLLEEETFTHDLGRKIAAVVRDIGPIAIPVTDLGSRLFDATRGDINGRANASFDPDFFLPVSRFPDEMPGDPREREAIHRALWTGEALSYFGIPDSARESVEDLGLVAVEYRVSETELVEFRSLFDGLTQGITDAALQVLLGYIRQSKSFTLPGGVNPDDPAFGRVTPTITYNIAPDSKIHVKGWLPKQSARGSVRHNAITSFLSRVTGLTDKSLLEFGEKVWLFLTSKGLLHKLTRPAAWQLDHERIIIKPAAHRHECPRCEIVTAYSANGVCPRKECDGKLKTKPFSAQTGTLIAQWVSDESKPRFTTLKSEEHTAQINKEVAKRIEDAFRAEGINLLSSTTTFEMGINIGDLQKVLLRNAPPASANYVQRVGRAGRGKDKNSVCVTICRRTKYDADAWEEPSRLMSGTIRPPTVFLKNRLIAQRHFNAVAFARFLRVKLRDELALGELLGQKISMEPFLPTAVREGIPPGLRKLGPDKFLAFPLWSLEQTATALFQSENCRELIAAVGDFSVGIRECGSSYESALAEVTKELNALAKERKQLSDAGYDDAAKPVGDAIKKLLAADVIAELARRGFLPRYAFPLDVTTLETGFTRWSADSDVELSRDRGIAISEFAPEAQVIARKQVFTSKGLYIIGNDDESKHGWYARCKACDQIRVAGTKEPLETPCQVCGEPKAHVHIARFVEPAAFSIRVDKSKRPHFRKATLLRQRQPLTHFTDRIEDSKFEDYGQFLLGLKPDGSLFRYNLGPRNEGFVLCTTCGRSSPRRDFKKGAKHQRLRPFMRNMDCQSPNLWGTGQHGIAYGHEFRSFCLIVRPKERSDSVESLMFALQKGMCRVLELDASDIGVSRRWLNQRTDPSAGVEIILYDRTPGGAGFVEEGKTRWTEVLAAAIDICQTTPSHTCEMACYDCLKDFGNQSYHDKLDRHSVLRFFDVLSPA
jgi:ATP-dependent helicase YprA (DUF1998 family)